MNVEKIARKYALKNAVEHEGKCNPGAVIGKIFAEEDFENKGEVQQKTQTVCQKVNELSLEKQEEELGSYEFEEEEEDEHDPIPDLEDAEEGEVVLRLAPNPNAPPHIGHGRMSVINGELKQKYDGKLILRYDDTDPQTKRPLKNEEYDAYQMQKEDFEWLGYEIDEVRYSSKNFDTYIEYAEDLIKLEKAYVCQCSQEEGQKYRKEGEACPHRDQTSDENMKLWKKMKEGGLNEGEAVLKIKTDMNHKNPAVRDFIAFRIIENPDHPITGDEYRVWPMLDFQGAIEDHLMGTTHIFRGKELRASAERQKYIYNYFGWEYPHVNHWGDVQISGFNAPVSSSTLKKMIENSELDGWDDPRAPTLRALRRRGFQPEAIRKFFIDMGVTENNIDASIETLETENTRVIDADTERRFFVRNPVELEISEVPQDTKVEIPKHPENDMGERNFPIRIEDGKITVLIEEEDLEDGLIRLKGLCNVQIEDGEGKFVEGDHTVALENNGNILHWVPEDSETAEVHMPNGEMLEGRIEPSNYEKNQIYQFERFGFVRNNAEKVFYYAHQ